jgi:multisubunit Na+/H+ antiporter MnhG subunit
MKRWQWLVLLALAIFLIITNPVGSAAIAKGIGNGLLRFGNAFSVFFTHLVS